MRWELDHVFIATPDRGAEAVAAEFGLSFTERRVHQGQGTENACARFENAFLELLFPARRDELESEIVRPLGFSERIRWQETGACPFGVCFRPVGEAADETALPFETWPYRPAYLPSGSSLPIVTQRGSLLEPLVFLLNRPQPGSSSEGTLHRGSRRTLTAVSVQSPHAVQSPAVRWFADHGLLPVVRGSEYLLELVWDHEGDGRSERLAAPLPLVVRW